MEKSTSTPYQSLVRTIPTYALVFRDKKLQSKVQATPHLHGAFITGWKYSWPCLIMCRREIQIVETSQDAPNEGALCRDKPQRLIMRSTPQGIGVGG